MRHTHQREIDGSTWTVNQFSASEGLRLMTRLLKLCGNPIATAMRALPNESILDAELDMAILADALADLTARLDENEVLDLIKRLVACTTEDGREVGGRFDTVFQGRYRTLAGVLMFVLEVNYEIPLAGWVGAVSAAGAGPSMAVTR